MVMGQGPSYDWVHGSFIKMRPRAPPRVLALHCFPASLIRYGREDAVRGLFFRGFFPRPRPSWLMKGKGSIE